MRNDLKSIILFPHSLMLDFLARMSKVLNNASANMSCDLKKLVGIIYVFLLLYDFLNYYFLKISK